MHSSPVSHQMIYIQALQHSHYIHSNKESLLPFFQLKKLKNISVFTLALYHSVPGDDIELVGDGENLLNYEGEFSRTLFIEAVVGDNSDKLCY